MPTIVRNLTLKSRTNFMLSWFENKKVLNLGTRSLHSIIYCIRPPAFLLHYAAFHLGLQCLPKYSCRGFQHTKGWKKKKKKWALIYCISSNVGFYNNLFLTSPVKGLVIHRTEESSFPFTLNLGIVPFWNPNMTNIS